MKIEFNVVADKLNIYVKRVVEDSVAGCDGRIRVNDHIVEVSLVITTTVTTTITIITITITAFTAFTIITITMFQVNGISLVGVSQKLAAQTLSNCAICPETGQFMMIDDGDDGY